MATAYTSLLGLALPVTGELSGSWGDVVNDSITSLLDTAVAGTTTLSTDGDVTLSTTTGTSNQARQAILLCSGARTALRTITAPAQSKIYTVINATTGGYSVKVVGAGPTTGVTIVAGESAVIAWNGSDFIKISNTGGGGSFTNVTISGTTTLSGLTASTALALNSSKEVVSVTNTGTGNNVLSASPTLTGTVAGASLQLSSLTSGRVTYAGASGLLQDSANLTFNGTDLTVSGAVNAGTINATTLDLTNLEVTNIKAKDGTAGMQIADSTGVVSFTANPVISGGTANGVAYLNGSKVLTTGSALTFDGAKLNNSSGSAAGIIQSTDTAGSGNFVRILADAAFGSLINFSTGSSLRFATSADNFGSFSEQMRLNSTGLGIGTSSPNGKLDVASGNVFITQDYELNWHTGGTKRSQIIGDSSNNLKFSNRVGGVLTETMRLDSSGNLGIGTSSPTERLQVNGGIITTGAFNGTSATGGSVILSFSTGLGSILSLDPSVAWKNLDIGSAQTTFSISGSEKMRLDSAGNLGLGVTPSAWSQGKAIEVKEAGYGIWNGTASIYSLANAYFDSGFKYANTGSAASHYYQFQGAHVWSTAPSGTAGNAISFTQAMTLDASGNLGVGTSSPTAKLHVVGSKAIFQAAGPSQGAIQFGTTDTTHYIAAGNDYLGMEINSTGVGNEGIKFFTGTSGSGSERMRLDSSGNLGLGVTPSAWSSFSSVFQQRGGSHVVGDTGAFMQIGANNYYNGTNWIYTTTAPASRFTQNNGLFQWYNAPSGTAGNAISFTQAMTLDASGNLALGGTSVDSGYRLQVEAGTSALRIKSTTTSAGAIPKLNFFHAGNDEFSIVGGAYLAFLSSGVTERARITSGGDLLVGTTTSLNTERLGIVAAGVNALYTKNTGGDFNFNCWNSATTGDNQFIQFITEASPTARGSITYNRGAGLVAYNTTSDYRAKDITGPVTDSGALIDSVPVYMGKMKGATQERPMFIAHEVPAYAHTGEKDAVDADGNPVYQQMDVSALVPVLWAEIQSLRQRLAAAGI